MDGILLIDKPPGITSCKVVVKIKRILKSRVGHGGTLDPQATGLLFIFVGKATKLAPFFYNFEKEYIAKARFGITTDTQDIWGNIISRKDPSSLTKEDICKVIERFRGKIEQIPPMVSAIHYQGRRLYELAREGKIVERKKKNVIIHKIEVCDFIKPEATFRIICSSGTYIRTLFSDIGDALGIGASLSFLRRTKIGKFSIEEAITLEELEEKVKKKEDFIISMSDALYFIDEVITDAAEKVITGKPFRFEGAKGGFVKIVTKDDIFIGIGENRNNLVTPIKIIATPDDFW